MVHADDEALTAPGSDALKRLLGDRPSLVLIDEIARYYSVAKGEYRCAKPAAAVPSQEPRARRTTAAPLAGALCRLERPRDTPPCPHHRCLAARAARPFRHRRSPQRADRGDEPAHQEDQANRARLPQLRQLQATATTALRRRLAHSLNNQHESEAAHDAWLRRAELREERDANEGTAVTIEDAGVEVSSEGLVVELQHVGAISFSHANSRFPVISELALRDPVFGGSSNVQIKVSLTCLGREMAEPWEMVVPKVGAEPVVFQGSQIQLVLKPLAFAEMDERHAGEFTVEVETDGGAQFTRTFPVDIVAYNQWQLYPSVSQMKDSLATLAPFVQPNQPTVEGVLRRARDILGATTQSTSTGGYQGDEARVVAIVQAIYLALQERHIRYSNPPASWDAQTQKIRLVPEVLGANPGEGVGTCLNTTITFASCLAAAGLNPVFQRQRSIL